MSAGVVPTSCDYLARHRPVLVRVSRACAKSAKHFPTVSPIPFTPTWARKKDLSPLGTPGTTNQERWLSLHFDCSSQVKTIRHFWNEATPPMGERKNEKHFELNKKENKHEHKA